MIINIDDYICPKCKKGYEFDTSKEYSNICTECGTALHFLANYDMDTEKTNKVPEMQPGQYLRYMNRQPTITCPTCHSTNVRKILYTERTLSIMFLGMSSNKFNKSFECKTCGYTW